MKLMNVKERLIYFSRMTVCVLTCLHGSFKGRYFFGAFKKGFRKTGEYYNGSSCDTACPNFKYCFKYVDEKIQRSKINKKCVKNQPFSFG